MREIIFLKFMDLLERHPSRIFPRIQIQILLMATAKAFRQKGKCVLFSKDPLQEYGSFTKMCMETKVDRRRLYGISYQLGRSIGNIVGFHDPQDRKRLVFLLYKNIGITMKGEIPGKIQVSRCFFSEIYTSRECDMISAMDAGIIAGICGNGNLHFTERITEGCDHCRACFYRRIQRRN